MTAIAKIQHGAIEKDILVDIAQELNVKNTIRIQDVFVPNLSEKVKIMRLIDADELTKKIMKWLKYDPNADDRMVNIDAIAVSVLMEIEEQPTAYDVDGVVNELKREKFTESETVLSDAHQGYNAGLSRAIDIVKDGGVE